MRDSAQEPPTLMLAGVLPVMGGHGKIEESDSLAFTCACGQEMAIEVMLEQNILNSVSLAALHSRPPSRRQ